MSFYLHDIPLPQAQARLESALREAGLWKILGIEEIPLTENAVGRVLAKPVWAFLSSPHYHASAMDGFAVRSKDTRGATPSTPIYLQCHLHDTPQAVYLDTGDPMPAWADAVIPIENVEPIDDFDQAAENPRDPKIIRLRTPVTPWSHIRSMGEDIVATQLVLPAGQVLRPVDLGAIAASGHDRICVARKPRVAVIPTGTELVEIGKPVRAGEIIEFNSLIIAGQVNEWGGEAVRYPIIPDELEAIRSEVEQLAQEHDLILLNAGSSAGSEDYTARVVQDLGDLLVHGVAIRPGHPVILGMVRRDADEKIPSIPIIGVPGYPVSAALTVEIFVQPLLSIWLGRTAYRPQEVKAELTRKVTSPPGDDDYLRVVVGKIGDRVLAAPLSRGAGVITSLMRADGLVILPRGTQGLPAGAPVNVRLYRSQAEIEETIFVIGSHDLTLDLLAQFLAPKSRRLVSANVGSLGGINALRRKEAHLAGSHLLDPESGEFNLAHIRQYLVGTPVKVVGMVGRQQGLLVKKGNPKRIISLEQLVQSSIRFINRQRGAGTRVLLDYQLGRLGIAVQDIQGYNDEEFTHLAVAVAVASGRADVGLGICAAARALDLDFVPLFQERYDLVIPTEYFDTPFLKPLLALLDDPVFRQAVQELPGYDVTPMGVLIAEME